MTLWLYRLVFLPALLFAGPRYLLRMRKRGGYGEHFEHRFGAVRELPPKQKLRLRVWIQAVSVGEMLAISPLIESLSRNRMEIYLTTTTSTGYRLALDRYRSLVATVGYFPLDWWPFVWRAWRRIDPDLFIVVEGERWPEHLRMARKRGVPVLNVNARMSDRSFARLRRFPSVARLMFENITRVLPCSAQDEARFLALGVPREKLVTTGNIKLDLFIPRLTDEGRVELRRELGLADIPVLLGSSTWPGEEEAMLAAWRRICDNGLACSLLLVPRHAERRDELERMMKAAGVRCHFRSRGLARERFEVAVADTTGELRRLTQLADVVFVGKSLPPHTEGQTPVEAASVGKPVLFGPGMSNFREIARDLLARGAAREVRNAGELALAAEELLHSAEKRAALSRAALQWRQDNAGAVDRTLEVLRQQLITLLDARDRAWQEQLLPYPS